MKTGKSKSGILTLAGGEGVSPSIVVWAACYLDSAESSLLKALMSIFQR